MPVNKGHFTQQEDHFTDRLCEYQSFYLNRNTYGLLPFRKGESVSGDFSITELVTGTLEVRLKRCHALTAGGYLIDYDAGDDDELTASFHISMDETEEKDRRWDVILMADPFEHLPSGIPDEKEISPPPAQCPAQIRIERVTDRTDRRKRVRKTLPADRPPA